MKYNIVSMGDTSNITAFIDGEMYTASNDHPNWDSIVTGAISGDEGIADLFDVAETVSKRFEQLTERVSVRNGQIYFDGDELDRAETKQIVRFLDDGVDDWEPLVLFLEKVQTNPNEHSREQLYSWLEHHDFPIDSDGDIIAYKGVKVVDDGYRSISQGKAIVDGEEHSGAIPNNVGSVVEMPRSEVHHDPSTGCSRGLHAGSWDYASGFAQGAVLTVKINPRDVVSVPTDCDWAKVRVCRYIVTGVTESEHTSAYWADDEDYEDDESWGEEEYDNETPVYNDTRYNYQKQLRDASGRFVKSV
jgi:hypothetical protein